MSKRLITALLVFLTMGAWAFAQTTITGKVVDESGEPLVGTNVMIKGTTSGTMTDYNGNYSLPNVRQGSVLVFSNIGYATQELMRYGSSHSLVNDFQGSQYLASRIPAGHPAIPIFFPTRDWSGSGLSRVTMHIIMRISLLTPRMTSHSSRLGTGVSTWRLTAVCSYGIVTILRLLS